MTEEAREFLREEMRGDYEEMIAHQEREIKQLEWALAEAEELIGELEKRLPKTAKVKRAKGYSFCSECETNLGDPMFKNYCPRCGARLEQ